jgi:hypothetical protein
MNAVPFAHAEIFIQEPALIRVRVFNGQEREIDITNCLLHHQFKDATAAAQFLSDMFTSGMHDQMILSNLRPHRPASEGKKTDESEKNRRK